MCGKCWYPSGWVVYYVISSSISTILTHSCRFAERDRHKLSSSEICINTSFWNSSWKTDAVVCFSWHVQGHVSHELVNHFPIKTGVGGVCYDKTLRWLERRSVRPTGPRLILPDTCLGFGNDWFGQCYSLRVIAAHSPRARLLVLTTRALPLGIVELLMHSPP